MNYDAWLHWVITERCVMGCEYCRTGDGDDGARRKAPLSPIDIPNLMRTLDESGMTFNISFTGGGEPFLVPNFVDACVELTQQHYISLYTNFAENQVQSFLERIDPSRVVYIIASCHIKSLERRQLLERFIQNCLACKEKGISLTVAEVAYPALLPEVAIYRQFFHERGIELKFGPFDGRYQDKVYPMAYTPEELEIFEIPDYIRHICNPTLRGEIPFCNAGYNAGIVRPNGDIHLCDEIRKNIGNIYRKIEFNKHILVCPLEYCGCQIYHHDPTLFERSKQEDLWFVRQVVWKNRIQNGTFWRSLINRLSGNIE